MRWPMKKTKDFLDPDLHEELVAEIAFNRLSKARKTAIILKYGNSVCWYRDAKISRAREILEDLSKGIKKLESKL
jgi:predicted HAD superfamily phosphohydrolase YqeG